MTVLVVHRLLDLVKHICRFLNVLLLARWYSLYSWSIPAHVLPAPQVCGSAIAVAILGSHDFDFDFDSSLKSDYHDW